MSNLNYTFFEEFKRLDKVCGELCGEKHGVTHYIDEMKGISGNDYRHIPNWRADLEQLIRLRHIRNYLAHTEGSFNEEVCTQKDVEWLQSFYRRILNQSDPLAMLYQYIRAKQEMEKARKLASQSQAPQLSAQYNIANGRVQGTNVKKNKNKEILYWVVFFLTLIGGVLLIGFIFVVLFIMSTLSG